MTLSDHAGQATSWRVDQSSVWIRGGTGAPERARSHLLSRIDDLSRAQAADAALIVSELVSNSVSHACVGIDQAICLELGSVDGHLRISVSDPGSALEPRLLPADPSVPGGFGLRVVEQICSAWGFERDGAGRTRVWCDLPLAQA